MHDVLLRHVGRLEEVDRLAEPQARDPVGDFEDVVQVVGDDDDGQVLVGEALDQIEYLTGLGDTECSGGLKTSRLPPR